MTDIEKEITTEDLNELTKAKQLLENPGLAAKITNFIGKPIESGLDSLPKKWQGKLSNITVDSLMKAANGAIFTMKDVPGTKASNVKHKFAVALSGGVGGFFGLPALAVELPVSTTIMLRSIADISREHGESISDVDTKFACLEVFAFGGNNINDDNVQSGYFTVRASLARSVTEASKYIIEKGLTEKGAPIVLKFITKIAERFSIQITEKLAGQAIPLIGAAGGAAINTMFLDHFQDMATGHFIVRKLERKYGEEFIKQKYLEI
ncbi:EcsC family protein [Aureivirga sp. CE67]|uniref:EcsC family protein n=1 Tax=Aureivirga sp. CE67 TaxID=1788983 RepID=UPI0018C8E526|nr:EcsC family protein [Aureivirga sp. CE67]